MLGNRHRLASWHSQPPGAHHLWSTHGCCQTLSHTLEPFCTATALPPTAAKTLLLNLYLGQNRISPQNLIYFLLPWSHWTHLGRMPAPLASSTMVPFSPASVWWLFSPGRAVFSVADSHPYHLCKQGSAPLWNPASSFKASQIFVYPFYLTRGCSELPLPIQNSKQWLQG